MYHNCAYIVILYIIIILIIINIHTFFQSLLVIKIAFILFHQNVIPLFPLDFGAEIWGEHVLDSFIRFPIISLIISYLMSYLWTQTPPQSTAAGSVCCCRWRVSACSWRGRGRSGRAAGAWWRSGWSRCPSAASAPGLERLSRCRGTGRGGWPSALRSLYQVWRAGNEVAPPTGPSRYCRPVLPPGEESVHTDHRGSVGIQKGLL